MTGVIGLITVILLVLLAGFIVTGFYRLTLIVRLALSYPLGLGLVTLQMFFYSLVGLHFAIALVAAPWVVTGVVLVVLKPVWFSVDGFCKDFKTRLNPLEVACLALLIFQAVFALVNSTAMPIKGYDTWVIWFMKGKVFYYDKIVSPAFFPNDVYSNGNLSYDYPLSVPLTVALGYLGIGGVDDQLAKLFFSLYFVSLLIMLYNCMRRYASREGSLILLAFFATLPRVMQQGGLDGVGYADLPLAGYFICATGFILSYIRSGAIKDFIFASLFLALGAWVKNEGIVFMATGFIMLTAIAVYKDRSGYYKPVLWGAFIMAALIGPWLIFRAQLPPVTETMTSGLSFSSLIAGFGKLPFIIKRILPKLFTADKYHITWALYSATLLYSIGRFKRLDFICLSVLIFAQMGVYIFVYMITTMDMQSQIDTSFDRLTIHILPLVFLCVALAWAKWFEKTSVPASL
ncbi:hypothetical protein EPN18_05470 [bacterium]|nr:MAG: hypothetical protein EPN18_05470 [bacterium]